MAGSAPKKPENVAIGVVTVATPCRIDAVSSVIAMTEPDEEM